jgi:hypothetical protein
MKQRKNEKGFILAMVICIFAVIAILSTAILSTATVEQKGANFEAYKVKAYYIARSGADSTAKSFIDNYEYISNKLKTSDITTDVTAFQGGGSFSTIAHLTTVGTVNTVTITSTGIYNNVSAKAVLVLKEQDTPKDILVTTNASGVFDHAIFQNALTTLDLYRAEAITGPVGSNGSTIVTNSDFTDTKTLNAGRTFADILPPYAKVIPALTVENNKITQSGYYGDLSMNNKTLTLDITSGDLNLVFNTFSTKGDIVIIDNSVAKKSRVNIYIYTEMNFLTGASFNNTEPSKLVIYLLKGSIFNEQANGTLKAYIYGPGATLNTNSDKTTIEGGVIADMYDVQNGTFIFNSLSDQPPFDLTVATTVTIHEYNYYRTKWQ